MMNIKKISGLCHIFKLATESDALEQSQEEIAEQVESAETFEEEPGVPLQEEPEAPEKKKSPIDAMEKALMNEATSRDTPIDRLVQIAKMEKKKFAIPAKITFMRVAEKVQQPIFNYAKDILYGRVPEPAGYEGMSKDFMNLRKQFEHMTEEDTMSSGIVNSLFEKWRIALSMASKRKFKGKKGKGRSQKRYQSPISPERKKRKNTPFQERKVQRPEEATPIHGDPTSSYTKNISKG